MIKPPRLSCSTQPLFAACLAFILAWSAAPAEAGPFRHFEISSPSDGVGGAPSPIRDAIAGLLEALNGAISGVLGDSFPFPENFDRYQWHGNEVPYLPGMEGLYYRIRDSRFQLAVEGSTGLQWLGSGLFLSEAKGALGIQINLIHPDSPDARIAVRISPLFVELAWFERLPDSPLHTQEEVRSEEGTLPGELLVLGSAMTLMLEKSFLGDNRAGIHIALRPGVDLADLKDGWSAETAESVFLRFPLTELSQSLFSLNSGGRLELEARVSHLRRGSQTIELLEEARSQPGREGLVPADLIENDWEGAVFLTWKH